MKIEKVNEASELIDMRKDLQRVLDKLGNKPIQGLQIFMAVKEDDSDPRTYGQGSTSFSLPNVSSDLGLHIKRSLNEAVVKAMKDAILDIETELKEF